MAVPSFDMLVGRVHWRLAALRFQLAWSRYEAERKALHHSNFQLRVPEGQTGGGQFTEGGAGGGVRVAVRDHRSLASHASCLRVGGMRSMPFGIPMNSIRHGRRASKRRHPARTA
jgi:hypothetical protein